MIKRLASYLLSLLVLVTVVSILVSIVKEHRYRDAMPLGEVISPAEDAMMADAVGMALRMINRTRDGLIEEGIKGDQTLAGTDYKKDKQPLDTTDGHEGPVVFRRDVHIKSHGCVKANFTVPELEHRYRWGVFAEPRTFEAWVRYSNGDYILNPDSTPDARGMAIKLMGVEGEKLLEWQKDATTQDFVMMNAKNYFIRYLADYIELTRYLAVGSNFGYFTNGLSLNLFSWRFRELKLVAGTKKLPPKTPLSAQYYSASAYKLGPDQNIKFSAKPVQCLDESGKPVPAKKYSWDKGGIFGFLKRRDYNFLRLRMEEQLKSDAACFDFMVQRQIPGEPMPVEDATIVWSERKSPFMKIAHLEIPAQEFNNDAQDTFCEDLSFNPWHSLPAHRPVGVFNRVRKQLYEEVAKYRRASNQSQYDDGGEPVTLELGQPKEPTSWCIDGSDGDCAPGR